MHYEPKHAEEEQKYRELIKKASFKCPIGRNPRNCDGHPCPHRDDDPFDDYYDECIDYLYARMELSMLRAHRGQHER